MGANSETTVAPGSLSLFSSAKNPVPQGVVTVEQLVAMVREPDAQLRGRLAQARAAFAAGEAEKYAALKRGLPAASFAGVFSKRNNQSLVAHSGLMPIDLDHLDAAALEAARVKLQGDAHCVFLYVSPSGEGLKGALRLAAAPADDAGHKRAFAAAENYLREQYGLTLDAACKDVARLAFLSHDPACYHSGGAVGLDVERWAVGVQPLGCGQGASQRKTDLPATMRIPRAERGGMTTEPQPKGCTPTGGVSVGSQENASQTPWQSRTATEVAAPGEASGTVEENDPGSDVFNDAWRADRFCDRWADEVRFVSDRDYWLEWADRWQRDTTGGCIRRAVKMGREIQAQVTAVPPRTKEDFHAQASKLRELSCLGDLSVIKSMLKMAQANTGVQCRVAELDADPFLLGTPNAVVNLRTGEGFAHDRRQFVTMSTRALFDPTARAPRWEQFIEEIFPDPELRHYQWKAWGYALTGSTKEKCFHFLIGAGDNGKSKQCEVIEWVMGDYAGGAPKPLLCSNDRGAYPLREAATIVGKRLLIGSETEANEKLNVGVVKTLTGHGDTMRAASLYENQYDFVPVGKLFVMGNHKPTINDTGAAIWKRVRLIPYERVFSDAEKDGELGEKLKAEAPGILNWLIQGALLWQAEGLKPPARVVAAVEEYRHEEDKLSEFIEEAVEPCEGGVLPHSALFRRYTQWAEDSGFRYPMTKRGLAKALREKGWQCVATGETRTAWRGKVLS